MWLKSRNENLSRAMPTVPEYRGFDLVGGQRWRPTECSVGDFLLCRLSSAAWQNISHISYKLRMDTTHEVLLDEIEKRDSGDWQP